MIPITANSFAQVIDSLQMMLLQAPQVNVGKWQSLDVSHRPEMVSLELRDVHICFPIPADGEALVNEIGANLPWAEDHFQERVCGYPWNPPPSQAWWPYAQQDNAEHKQDGLFSHTYPERFWPKFAAVGQKAPNGRLEGVPHQGIRYEYGDLGDVVELLKADTFTRQAYLPIWFPEDTGNSNNVRVPCSLGYHFLFRDNRLHLTYFIRSCDFMRHFRDDVYMAIRLAAWVGIASGLLYEEEVELGDFTMVIPSLHIFQGDVPILRRIIRKVADDRNHKTGGNVLSVTPTITRASQITDG